MKTIKLSPVMEEDEANNLIGTFMDDSFIKHLIEEDTEVYKENGDLLCVLKKNAVPDEISEKARASFRKSVQPSDNRGNAAGDISKLYKIIFYNNNINYLCLNSRINLRKIYWALLLLFFLFLL